MQPHALTDDRLESVLDIAALQPDVNGMSEGPETHIGELGIRISGGQRQRLGLARAIAAGWHTPGLLVLDDPFSAVDIDTETRIVANLRSAISKASTIILFSQRMAAFPQADLVVVLDAGRVVECGTHACLLEAGGLYARIYRAQMRVARLGPVEVQPS
jgi:ABC-type multidrug transport system fused ATPase/permease subunit